ncbi:MAG: DUF488 domain-containing protein [Chloroflexota bacterium]
MGIRVKRVYDAPAPADGTRILVDRVWPRGVGKETAGLDGWFRDLAPSPELRKWFGHDPARWDEFRRRYTAELQSPEKQARLEELRRRARQETVTLLYGARDREHNQAVALAAMLG